MPQYAYKITSPTMAILADGDHEVVVTIPANAIVVLVDGILDESNGFVRVRYRNEILSVFAVDLRNRGERAREESA